MSSQLESCILTLDSYWTATKPKYNYYWELCRKMKRLCSSCISIHAFLPLPILPCFPSLCSQFHASVLSLCPTLSSLAVCKHFCIRGWDERKTGHILWGSQNASSSEFAEADEKHSWKCETFRWDLRLGIFKCFQCSTQTLELLWLLSVTAHTIYTIAS